MKAKIKKIFLFALHFLQLVLAWIVLHTIQRRLLKQDIWLIREKRDEARDNGYHFYKYLKEHQKNVNAFYVITSSSSDRHRVEKYDEIIEADSFKHCLYFLASKFSINSQPFGAYPFHFDLGELKLVKKICNRNQKVVFLQQSNNSSQPKSPVRPTV